MEPLNTSNPNPEYPHLCATALKVIGGSKEERINFVEVNLKDQTWIGYGQANAIVSDLKKLLERSGAKRPECRLIVGPSNNGKSRIIERFYKLVTPEDPHDSEGSEIPVLMIQAPENPSIGGFFDEVLLGLNAPAISGSSAKKRKDAAIRICQSVGLKMLVIDEIQHLASGTQMHRYQCLNAIKSFSTQLRISIVGAGTEEAVDTMVSLNQVENRFRPHMLDLWQDGAEFSRLLCAFEKVLPLRKASGLDNPDIRNLVLNLSEGAIGEMYFLLRDATIAAIQQGKESIDADLIRKLGYQGPTARTTALRTFAAKLQKKTAGWS